QPAACGGTAMFSVVNTVLLRPLPYFQPQRLRMIELPRSDGDIDGNVSLPLVQAWQKQLHDFQSIACVGGIGVSLEGKGRTDFVDAATTSTNLFATLGAHPLLGRLYSARDENKAVAVLSYTIWQKDFAGKRSIVGQPIRAGGKTYTVIGILPEGINFPVGWPSLYTPMAPTAQDLSWTKSSDALQVFARLRPGISPAAAQAELNGVEARLARAHPDTPKQASLRDYREELAGPVRPALNALMGATALVWLIACLSVAGLLLTRFAARRRELSIRAALGAGSVRLAREAFAECILIALGACAAGWALAEGCVALAAPFMQSRLPAGLNNITVSGSALWGLAGVTVVSVLLIGLLPALLAARAPAQTGLRDAGRSASAGRGQARLRDSLVIGETALALLLLAGAGLLLRTLYAMRSVPLGFTTRNLVTTQLMLPGDAFAKRDVVTGFYRPTLEKVEHLPGIEAAALTTVIPLERGMDMTMQMSRKGKSTINAQLRMTTPGYVKVFGAHMVAGRFFDATLDTPTSQQVTVVNQAFVRRYFPGQHLVGHTLNGKKKGLAVVGVLANVHDAAIGQPAEPEMFFSTTQLFPGTGLYGMATGFTDLAVRTRLPEAAITPALRQAVHDVAPTAAVEGFMTMQQIVSDAMGSQIFAARLLGVFGLAALAIALAGLYGLLAYAVTQRRREMGIRMALGASPQQIRTLVLSGAAWRVAIGIAIGLALTLALAKVLSA
ncbi:MAG: ADOP family duplicated permease, partial [Terriglobales bacterium]